MRTRFFVAVLMSVTLHAFAAAEPNTGIVVEKAQKAEDYPYGAELKIGDNLDLPDGMLTFTKVDNDTRCPQNTLCITQGNAQVYFDLMTPQGEKKSIMLDTSPGSPTDPDHPARITLDKTNIQLEYLQPLPQADAPIEQKHYQVHLLIDKN